MPCGPINTIDKTFAEPQVQASRHRPRRSSIPSWATSRWSASRSTCPTAPQPEELRPTPELGEHTDEVLASLGYDRKAIDALKAGGVI